jgi:DNA transformation protein and related proteins
VAFDDPEALRELFSSFGTVSVRRMFGGHGVFAEGLMFGLESGGELYLKADDLTVPKFVTEKSEPFVYNARGREIALSYWRLPERLYDEPDDFALFARDAFGAAQRAASHKSKKKKAPAREPAKTRTKKRR